MKKIKSLIFFIFAFFIITTPLCAAPWTHLALIDDISKYKGKGLALDKIMDGQTVNYCIDGNTPAFGFEKLNDLITNYDYSYRENQPPSSERKESEKKQNVFEYWLSGTWKEIEKAGRQKDFADLKKLLTSPVKMKLQQCSKVKFVDLEEILSQTSGKADYVFSENAEDIRFIFYTGKEGYQKDPFKKYKINGFFSPRVKKNSLYVTAFSDLIYSRYNLPPTILIKNEDLYSNLYYALAHETGHFFGMGDTYKDNKNASKKHRAGRRNPALMNTSKYLTCDDADGLINLIDRLNNYKRGGKKGWRGLCKGYYRLYINSKPAIDLTEMKISLELTKKAIRKNFENLRFDW